MGLIRNETISTKAISMSFKMDKQDFGFEEEFEDLEICIPDEFEI